MTQKLLTLGQVADAFDVQLWQVQKVINKGMVPTHVVQRVGRWRGVAEDDMTKMKEALQEAGYLYL